MSPELRIGNYELTVKNSEFGLDHINQIGSLEPCYSNEHGCTHADTHAPDLGVLRHALSEVAVVWMFGVN